MDARTDEAMAALLAEDASGYRVFHDEEIRHAIPLLALASGVPLLSFGEDVQELIALAAIEAGIDEASSEDDAVEAWQAYYAERPVNPQILAILQELGGQGAPEPAARKVLGLEEKTTVLGGGERPKGTVPGSLARLAKVPKKPTDRQK